MSDVARTWLQGLAARGISVSIKGGRLRLSPGAAYKTLTDDELLTLRHHRNAIKIAVADGVTRATAVSIPTPPCPYCCRPCVGREHQHFDLLHATDPIEQQLRAVAQQKSDDQEWELRRQYQLPAPRWL